MVNAAESKTQQPHCFHPQLLRELIAEMGDMSRNQRRTGMHMIRNLDTVRIMYS